MLRLYLLLVNSAAFVLCLADKRRARQRQRQWRVPEATLLLLSALGGSCGMLLGMLLFRHKTRHLKFMLGVPLMLLVQLALLYRYCT